MCDLNERGLRFQSIPCKWHFICVKLQSDEWALASMALSIWQKILWNSLLRMLKSKRFIRTYQVVQIYSKTNSLILIDATMLNFVKLEWWDLGFCIHCDGMYQHKSEGCWNLTLACHQG
jgi:hypothetical protein